MRSLIGTHNGYLIYVWSTGKYEAYIDLETSAGVSGKSYDEVVNQLD